MKKLCSKCGEFHDINYKCNKRIYMKKEEDKLRNTSRWNKKSKQIKEDAEYICEVCRDLGIHLDRYSKRYVEVHHINKLREDPDNLLNDDLLICLCKKHHLEADKGKLSKEYLISLVKKRL